MRVIATLFACTLGLAGCTVLDLGAPERGEGAGQSARYALLTHCGIEYAYFDERYWLADPPPGDGSGNPPPGWENPTALGTMTRVSPARLRFTSDKGQTTFFRPAPASYEPPGCA